MYKVFTITIGSYLMKVGVCGENDTLPKSAGLVSVIFQVYDLDEAQSLARRLANSMGNIHNHEVYMASDNGQILYVGMGKHGRHKHLTSGYSHVKEANEYSGDIQVEVVQRGLSRRQAAKYEAEMIAELSPSWNRVQPKVVDDDGDDLETTVEGFDIVEPKKDYRNVKESKIKYTDEIVISGLISESTDDFKKYKHYMNELLIFKDEDIREAVAERWLERAASFSYMNIYHSDFFSRMLELGNGSLKSGDFNKEVMTLIKEYCWNESGLFVDTPWDIRIELRKKICGNYITALGLEYGRRAGLGKKVEDNGYTIEDLERADGKVVRSFLQRLGMVVFLSKKQKDGKRGEYATIKPASFIIHKEMAVQEMVHPMKDTIDTLMNDFRGHFK